MKKFIILLLIVFNVQLLFSQSVCSNFDFDYGDFFNWIGKTGTYESDDNGPNNLYNWTATNIPHALLPTIATTGYCFSASDIRNRFMILARPATGTVPTDPQTGNRLSVFPQDTLYKRVARLGNSCGTREAEALCFRYKPGIGSNLLILNYAIVLENPGHWNNRDNPSFQIHVKNDEFEVGNYTVPSDLRCAELDINAYPAIIAIDTAYHSTTATDGRSVIYRSWTKVGIDLRHYENKSIEIELDIGDCSVQKTYAHYAYVYFTGTCGRMQLNNIDYYGATEYSDTVSKITAPDGFLYTWTIRGGDGSIDTLNNLNATGNFNFLQRELYIRDSDFGNLSAIKVYCELTSLVVGTDGNRCKANLEINVDNNRPLADFEMNTDPCDTSRTVRFTTTSIERASPLDSSSIKWDFGDGTTDTVPHPQHRYAAPGAYVVKYSIASEIGIRSYKIDSITLEPLPVAIIDSDMGNPSKICPGGTLNLQALNLRLGGRDTCLWSANNVMSYGNTFTSTIDNTTTIKLIVTDTKTGCTDSSFHVVNVIPRPEIIFTGDSIICMGNSTTLTAHSDYGVEYWWNEGTQGASITKTPSSDTSFTVYVQNEVLNCVSSKTVHISITIPKLESSKLTICPGESVILTVSGAHAYKWTANPADTNLSDVDLVQSQLIVSPSQTTTYSVVGKGQNGCSSDPLSKTVTVYPYPVARFECTPDYIDSENPVVAFRDRSESADIIFWDFGDGTTTEQRNPSHKYMDLSKDSVRVFLKVSNKLGCSDSIFKYLPVGIFTVWSPNSFTPDATTNNIFKFYSKNKLRSFSLVIYDRWGQQVFQSNNISIGWDGTYKGKKCPTGSYVWIMSYERQEDSYLRQQKGNINLIR